MIPPGYGDAKTPVRVFAMMTCMKCMVAWHKRSCPSLMQEVMNITKSCGSPGKACKKSKKIIKPVRKVKDATIQYEQHNTVEQSDFQF